MGRQLRKHYKTSFYVHLSSFIGIYDTLSHFLLILVWVNLAIEVIKGT